MNKTAVFIVLLTCMLASCAAPEMVPPPQPTALPATMVPTRVLATSPVPTATPKPAVPTATSLPSLTSAPQSTASVLRLTSGGLTVIIEAPEDGTTLSTSPVEFKGKALAGTVISINELNLVVGSSGAFSAAVKLESGSNLIEFLASDAKGNQVSYFFTVFLEP